MIRRPPRSTRTDTLFPYTTLFRSAHAVQPVSVLQTEYSLFTHDIEAVFPTLDELGIGFVAYSPLARGFLTGGVKPADQHDSTDSRSYGAVLPWWEPGNFEKNHEIVQRLTTIAEARSEERRVGQEGVSTCKSRWTQYH